MREITHRALSVLARMWVGRRGSFSGRASSARAGFTGGKKQKADELGTFCEIIINFLIEIRTSNHMVITD